MSGWVFAFVMLIFLECDTVHFSIDCHLQRLSPSVPSRRAFHHLHAAASMLCFLEYTTQELILKVHSQDSQALSRVIGLASVSNQNPVLILPWVFLPAEAKGSRSVNSFCDCQVSAATFEPMFSDRQLSKEEGMFVDGSQTRSPSYYSFALYFALLACMTHTQDV